MIPPRITPRIVAVQQANGHDTCLGTVSYFISRTSWFVSGNIFRRCTKFVNNWTENHITICRNITHSYKKIHVHVKTVPLYFSAEGYRLSIWCRDRNHNLCGLMQINSQKCPESSRQQNSHFGLQYVIKLKEKNLKLKTE